MKKVVVILGSGRSGTSLTMNVVSNLGVRVSEDLIGKSETNKKGAFEDKEIFDISRDILRFFYRRGSRLGYLPMPKDWVKHDFVQSKIEDLVEIVEKNNQNVDTLWGFKEPVTVKLLPMWDVIFQKAQVEPIYLLSYRKPHDVIRSFERAYGTGSKDAELIWLSRYSEAVLNTNGEFLLLDYNLWFTDAITQALQIIKYIGLDWKGDEISLKQLLSEVIDETLYTTPDDSPILSFSLTKSFSKIMHAYLRDSTCQEEVVSTSQKVTGFIQSIPCVELSVDEIENKDARIARLVGKNKNKDARIANLIGKNKKKDARIARLVEKNKNKDIHVKRLVKENDRLRGSASYQVGRTIIKGVKAPGMNTLTAPLKIIRILLFRAKSL